MKKIVILIQNNALLFTYKTNQVIREDLMNTNIISDSELVFSDDYILENAKLVLPFFQELCEMNSIDTLTFQSNRLALFLLDFFKNTKVRMIRIKKQESTLYELCEKIIRFKNIRELDCYSIPNYLIELLDKHHIKVTTHSEILYLSNFMKENKLEHYSEMYYQRKITIYHKLTEEDESDLESFFKVNQYLKVIVLLEFHREDIEFILECLKNYRLKNIYIELHTNITKEEDFLYLKQLNKNYKNQKLEIGLYYSDEYLSDNFMKQVMINTIRLSGIVIVLFIMGMIGSIAVRNYTSLQEVSSIQEEVKKTMDNSENMDIPDTDESTSLTIKNKYIASLLTINPDVVGYLKVNNTAVDYPVVVGPDNKAYLRKNLYGEYDYNGWVFMDFRNSEKFLNDNTIIYGHNMYYSDVMFGTLHKALSADWYNNPENLVISFNTMYETMNWQIYSIYSIPKTNDYLKVTFTDAEKKMEFINMTKGRSIKDFGVEVTVDDHILTLSTCTGSNSRLVIHAKLLPSTESLVPDSSDNESPSDLAQ